MKIIIKWTNLRTGRIDYQAENYYSPDIKDAKLYNKMQADAILFFGIQTWKKEPVIIST